MVHVLKLLRRLPYAGERGGAAGLVVGFVVGLHVVVDESAEVERVRGHGNAIGLVAGLLGEAPGGDVEPAVARARVADGYDVAIPVFLRLLIGIQGTRVLICVNQNNKYGSVRPGLTSSEI